MAPSKESGALAELFKGFVEKFPADGDPFISRCIYDQVQQASAEASDVTFEDIVVAGRPCKWVRPAGASKNHVILFMHGGGFCFGSPSGHRKLAAHLAKASNCAALSVDYRLTPEHPYPAPLDDCVAAYSWLLEQGFAAERIATAGDSCGGGLATSVPLAARARGLAVPGAAVALSPWYDLTGGGASRTENATADVLNTPEFVDVLARRYIGSGGDKLRKDPLISPIFAEELAGLPPHWISCGGHDLLRDDGTRFAEKLKAQGVEVVLEVHEAQQHVMEFMVGKAPEADESIRKIGQWLQSKIGA